MGKASSGAAQSQSKSAIAKEKLCDRDFDELVIGTSHEVTQRSLLHESPSPDSSSSSIEPLQSRKHDETEPTCELNYSLSQPKRPMNAFMVWGQAIRRELHGKFSNVQNALLSKALGRVWRSLDPAEKEMFVRKANLIKANHKRDYPNYRYRPRRLQERRAKCNMLIGIQLNHPVNQHPIQTNFSLDHVVTYPHTQVPQALRDQSTRQFTYDKHNQTDSMMEACMELNNESVEVTRQAGPVQTYEYQPYPAEFQANSTTHNRACPTADVSRNTRLCLNNQGSQSGFHEFQQHAMASTVKQTSEFGHPLYRQYAYSIHHQQQYQQQQQQHQPPNYNVAASGYSTNNRGPLIGATSCNMSNEYYTTVQSNLSERPPQGFFTSN